MPEQPDPKPRAHPARSGEKTTPPVRPAPRVAFAELDATSNFTFLTGASHPEELAQQAARLGYTGVAVTDTNTLAGIVRAHVGAADAGVPLIVGCRIVTSCALRVLVYPTDRPAYARLCRLLTLGKRRAPKGECHLEIHDLIEHSEGLLAIVDPPQRVGGLDQRFIETLRGLRRVFDDDRLSLASSFAYLGDDADRLEMLATLGAETRIPLVATNRALYHEPARRPLQDVVTCIRHGCTIEQAGMRLGANAERHLKPPEEISRLFARYPEAVARSVEIASRAGAFSLDELRYEYPVEPCPPGLSPIDYLRQETWKGAVKRYGRFVPVKVRTALAHELSLIEELRYEPYFLTCYDIVTHARSLGILCQGRGGAANSAVCYCLGITEVDPGTHSLLFERFISRERGEPPDIDIDFEHERREEVIQYIYSKYGRDRAALTAEVISYRGRSAVREVGKAMGLPIDCVDALAKNLDRWGEAASAERVAELGLNPEDPIIKRVLILTRQLMGFPRHLSQHVGGFVITRSALSDLVPIENAAMEDRTVIEWDKDDIDAMGMLKVDCLGLGMLTCIRKALELLQEGAEGGGISEWEPSDEHNDESDPNVSRSSCLESGHGDRSGGLHRIGSHAGYGALRADEPDAQSSGIDPLQHRRGIREGVEEGVLALHQDRTGISGGTGDSVRTRDLPRDAQPQRGARISPERGRTRAPVTANETASLIAHSESDPSAPLPLCPSAPSPVYPLYARIAKDPTDAAVYDMICAADTVGVFQIESRAQMSMLPRLRPREFYDLVIEVAIVRPGPIQGGMVHPYLKRRQGKETISYPSPEIEAVLGRTLGVPIFQEQAMQLAIVAAGFTPDESDSLRRAMAAWKRKGDAIYRFGQRLIEGMLANGYPEEFAKRCFEQIKGFSEYGFPESHAASFALLVYVSAWLKHHHPATFAAALINSQPMGFYQPAQIVRDAEDHGVEVRPVDVNHSAWDCTLENGGKALRLGMRLVKGMPEDDARCIDRAVRTHGSFRAVEPLWRASGVSSRALKALARADAFNSMGLDRQRALWQIKPLRDAPLPLFDRARAEDDRAGLDRLPRVEERFRVLHDYESTGLSLKAHPIGFMRTTLEGMGVIPTSELRSEERSPQGRRVRVAGIVLCRQRPSTASGVVFITLEDEVSIANLIIWRDTFEEYRRVARLSTVLLAEGKVERQGEVVHIHVQHLESLDDHLPALATRRMSRDFH